MDTVKVLVERGAKVELRDESQQQAKDVAARFNHQAVEEYLTTQAPAISKEARARYAQLVPEYNDQGGHLTADPMVDSIAQTEENNLQRIISTARWANEKLPPVVTTPSRPRKRKMMLALFVFGTTVLVGLTVLRKLK